MIVLQWFKPAAPVGLQWLVPVQAFPAPVAAKDLEAIAVVVGPPGNAGGQRIDVMTGIVTGQTQFILSSQPSDISIVRMFVNGQKFRAPSFTMAGDLVVWASEFLIEVTDEIEFTY